MCESYLFHFSVISRCWRRWSRQRRKPRLLSTQLTSLRKRRWLSWRGMTHERRKCLSRRSNVMWISHRCHSLCTHLVSTRRPASGRRRGRWPMLWLRRAPLVRRWGAPLASKEPSRWWTVAWRRTWGECKGKNNVPRGAKEKDSRGGAKEDPEPEKCEKDDKLVAVLDFPVLPPLRSCEVILQGILNKVFQACFPATFKSLSSLPGELNELLCNTVTHLPWSWRRLDKFWGYFSPGCARCSKNHGCF